MGWYSSKAQSTPFVPKDEAKLIEFLESIGDADIISFQRLGNQFALFMPEGIPSYDAEEEEIDFIDRLADHVPEGSVAIVMETGMGNNGLHGYACAISNGTVITRSLTEIYEMAREEFGVEIPSTDHI